ncbi:MAG: hypothetical protein PHH82_01340 [Candidatus ainarchaeum sp.]|nr:hypothetical protein [Candidatus ainarchaeum sp.]
MNREQRNPVDTRLKELVEKAVKQGASQDIIYKLMESARRIKDRRFRQKTASKIDERKSIPFHEAKKRTDVYSIDFASEWRYGDAYDEEEVRNRLGAAIVKHQHYVLKDSIGAPRFVLGFFSGNGYFDDCIRIDVIQRLRTKPGYLHRPTLFRDGLYDYKTETNEANKFRKELGMHPAEFLLAEFILRNKSALLRGKKILLNRVVGRAYAKNYLSLIERYFKEGTDGFYPYELDLTKSRVKEILGI